HRSGSPTQLQLEAQHEIPSSSGALPLGNWVEDGTIYCLLDAADEEAVCRHHRERGVRCEDLHPLSGISGIQPLSGKDRSAGDGCDATLASIRIDCRFRPARRTRPMLRSHYLRRTPCRSPRFEF
ncbi:MAG: DUF4242 domain-containing protein, partial [Chloroflexi bacterium]|nr:DUF4242 domain-containing protein [Chloroflexota bacterium]